MPDDWLPSDTANYLGDEDGDRIRDDGDEALADTPPQNVPDSEEGENSTEGGRVGVGVGVSTRRKPSSSGDGLGRGKRVRITNVRTPTERGRRRGAEPGTDTLRLIEIGNHIIVIASLTFLRVPPLRSIHK